MKIFFALCSVFTLRVIFVPGKFYNTSITLLRPIRRSLKIGQFFHSSRKELVVGKNYFRIDFGLFIYIILQLHFSSQLYFQKLPHTNPKYIQSELKSILYTRKIQNLTLSLK